MFSRVRDINGIVTALVSHEWINNEHMIIFPPRIFLMITLLLGLWGCSSLPDPISDVEWQSHQARLKTIKQFQLVGKLAYIDLNQRQSLNFQWQISPQQTQLRLSTFLGQTVLNLSIDQQGAQVITHDDNVYRADNAEQLIASLTGLTLPMELLQAWIIGLPTQADHFELNSNNTLAKLQKKQGLSRWTVDYHRYREYPWQDKPLPLPDRVLLTQQDTSINLVISKWTLTP